MDSVTFRPASPDDISVLAALYVASRNVARSGLYDDAYIARFGVEAAAEEIRALGARPGWRIVVAEVGGETVAFAIAGPWEEDQTVAEVDSLYVHPSHFRQGIGRKLLRFVEARLESDGFHRAVLWILDEDQGAHGFYPACGWQTAGRFKEAMRDKPRVLSMWEKELAQPPASLVKAGYNRIGESYARTRSRFRNAPYLEQLVARLAPGATVLDLGCGSGLPIDRFLVDRGFTLIGLDISERQVERARRNVPEGSFEAKDMLALSAGEYQADAIVSFYAIFHTPKEHHAGLLKTMSSLLRGGGWLLITMGAEEREGVEPDFHGVEMYWSHFARETNRKLVLEAGFDIVTDEIDESGGERHQVILAEYHAK